MSKKNFSSCWSTAEPTKTAVCQQKKPQKAGSNRLFCCYHFPLDDCSKLYIGNVSWRNRQELITTESSCLSTPGLIAGSNRLLSCYHFTLHQTLHKKSRIRETPTLLTDEDSRTDTILERLRGLPIRTEKRTWSTRKCRLGPR